MPLDPPTITKPTSTSGADSRPDPAAARMQPPTPRAQPVASTGTRRCRSIARPAGRAATADDARNTAGPRPRIDSMPVTRTSVIVETATTSWSMPLRHVSVAASRTVFRRTSAGAAPQRSRSARVAHPDTRSTIAPIRPSTSPAPVTARMTRRAPTPIPPYPTLTICRFFCCRGLSATEESSHTGRWRCLSLRRTRRAAAAAACATGAECTIDVVVCPTAAKRSRIPSRSSDRPQVQARDVAVLAGDAMALDHLGRRPRHLGNLVKLAPGRADTDDGRDRVPDRPRVDHGRVAGDDAALLEPLHALAHSRGRAG